MKLNCAYNYYIAHTLSNIFITMCSKIIYSAHKYSTNYKTLNNKCGQNRECAKEVIFMQISLNIFIEGKFLHKQLILQDAECFLLASLCFSYSKRNVKKSRWSHLIKQYGKQ